MLAYDPYNEQKLEYYLQVLMNAGHHKQAHKILLAYEQKLKEDLALSPSPNLKEISKKNYFKINKILFHQKRRATTNL